MHHTEPDYIEVTSEMRERLDKFRDEHEGAEYGGVDEVVAGPGDDELREEVGLSGARAASDRTSDDKNSMARHFQLWQYPLHHRLRGWMSSVSPETYHPGWHLASCSLTDVTSLFRPVPTHLGPGGSEPRTLRIAT